MSGGSLRRKGIGASTQPAKRGRVNLTFKTEGTNLKQAKRDAGDHNIFFYSVMGSKDKRLIFFGGHILQGVRTRRSESV